MRETLERYQLSKIVRDKCVKYHHSVDECNAQDCLFYCIIHGLV